MRRAKHEEPEPEDGMWVDHYAVVQLMGFGRRNVWATFANVEAAHRFVSCDHSGREMHVIPVKAKLIPTGPPVQRDRRVHKGLTA